MKTLITNAKVVNEGKVFDANILINNKLIEAILPVAETPICDKLFDAIGLYLLPGCIDDQTHFREPGLTHKGEIYTEAKAAVAGGITSYMEMPNTIPNALTQDLLEDKYKIANEKSLANYSFYMGASNDNLDEVLKTNPKKVCGVKIFMGSSTGNMLVDNERVLEQLFSKCKMLIATHCEDEGTIKRNLEIATKKFGDNIPITEHPIIRSVEACYKSSSHAVALAKKYNTRLHVLHISTEKELSLFENKTPLKSKKITAEACIHHLWFCDEDYTTKGNLIKWNPAIKTAIDREAIFNAILNGTIDVVATDHAPHTFQEKMQVYSKAPSGGPLVQHALLAMLEKYKQSKITLEKIVQLMSHNVADIFEVEKRGYIREGYFADLVLVDLQKQSIVNKDTILYKCGWSPFDGYTFNSSIHSTFVNGHLAYTNNNFDETKKGLRLTFNR